MLFTLASLQWMQKEENYAITNLSDPESSLSQLLMFLLQESAVMKLLLVFSQPFQFGSFQVGQSLKPFDDVPKLICVQQLPCPDGKQALSTKACLYQDLRVKWATLQMVEHYMMML